VHAIIAANGIAVVLRDLGNVRVPAEHDNVTADVMLGLHLLLELDQAHGPS
jgi:hypothetical protein